MGFEAFGVEKGKRVGKRRAPVGGEKVGKRRSPARRGGGRSCRAGLGCVWVEVGAFGDEKGRKSEGK